MNKKIRDRENSKTLFYKERENSNSNYKAESDRETNTDPNRQTEGDRQTERQREGGGCACVRVCDMHKETVRLNCPPTETCVDVGPIRLHLPVWD